MIIIETKICSKCKIEYPATYDYFYKVKKKSKKEGEYYILDSWCKTCKTENNKNWTARNHEKVLEYKRKHNSLEYRKLSNREVSKQQRLSRKHKQYQKDHPEKLKMYNEKRQNKNHNINKKEWNSCKDYFNNQCAYCGLPISEHFNKFAGELKWTDFHKEHVNHEGMNDLSNCIPSCKNCNSQKWEFPLEDWYNEDNPVYNKKRLNKIHKWLNEDWKKYYIEKKPKIRPIKKEKKEAI